MTSPGLGKNLSRSPVSPNAFYHAGIRGIRSHLTVVVHLGSSSLSLKSLQSLDLTGLRAIISATSSSEHTYALRA